MVAFVAVGLYSNGMKLMEESFHSKMFPNIVFSSYIIISSVIALGYILGNIMPSILIRIFNIVGMTLYFVSACVTTQGWYMFKGEEVIAARMLLSESILCFLNAAIYAFAIYCSIKKALTNGL